MGKSKPKIVIVDDSTQKNDWVRILSFVIIALCILLLIGLLGVMAWRSTNNNPDLYRVIVTTNTFPDSLKAYNYIDYETVDSLINAVKTYDDQLTQKYQYLVEQKEQDSQVFYWGSLIVGIVIAVFGWFGFQSFTTIEDKAKKKATSVASLVAMKETLRYLEDEGSEKIKETAKNSLQEEAVQKVKKQVIDDLNIIIEDRLNYYVPTNKIDDLEKRIESMEESIKPSIEKVVKETFDDYLDKYRRNSSNSK